MDVLLIAGLWLDATAWDDVASHLQALGQNPIPISLPGQGAPPPTATLEDQRAAVVAAVDASAGRVLVVGHSAASALAWMAADARPARVAKVVMVGGFPAPDGTPYAEGFPVVDGMVPFPGWETFEGPDSADLDEQQRAAIAARAVGVPEAVAKGIVHLENESRFEVPVSLICPEFSPAQAKAWVDAGQLPELGRARQVEYLDIDSGHWPMFTRPAELAELLAARIQAADSLQ